MIEMADLRTKTKHYATWLIPACLFLACSDDVGPMAPNSPTPDAEIRVDMGGDRGEPDAAGADVFVRPGPELLDMTHPEAQAAWSAPVAPQIFDGQVFVGTGETVGAVLEIAPDSPPTLESYVSLRQAPDSGNLIPRVESAVVTESSIFATTGLADSSEGLWFWSIERSTMSVEGALWLDGCLPANNRHPLGYDREIVFVPCKNFGVITVDVSVLKRPEISRIWSDSGSIDHVQFVSARSGRQSFMAVGFGGVELVALTEFGMSSVTEYEFPESHRPIYGSVRFGGIVAMRPLGEELLVFRYSTSTRASPFQRIPFSVLGIQ